MQNAKDVDKYIASAPENMQDKLNELRSAIKIAAPKKQRKSLVMVCLITVIKEDSFILDMPKTISVFTRSLR